MTNCEILQLTWSNICFVSNAAGAGTFAITDIDLYVPVVALSTPDNTKLLAQSGSQK